MDNFFILFFCGTAVLILAIFIILRKHYRKVIKSKEHALVHHIREQDKLAKELQYINMEKKVMEKMLKGCKLRVTSYEVQITE